MKLIAVILLFALLPLYAQLGTEGAIVGVISDQSGAVIPSAVVEITNTKTGLHWSTLTDNAGTFQVLELPPGRYALTVTAKGFSKVTVEAIDVALGEIKRVPATLEVGKTTQTALVQAQVERLQTDTAQVSSVVEEHYVKEIPLNGRDPISLVSLAPGLMYGGKGSFDQESTVTPAGKRADQTQFQVDGMSSQTPLDERGSGFPNVDTVEEFSVQTDNFGAENGRGPTVVNVLTKGGTNQFHGSLWEFVRNSDFAARNTFASIVPKLAYNQFGGTVGGPILKNKTFFFFSYEGTRIAQQAVQTFVAPSAAEFNGVFPKTIKDPTTGQPFPNNSIPSPRIDPAAAFFFPYILRPNSADGLYHNVLPNPESNNRWYGRIDHQITNRQRIYGRVIQDTDVMHPPFYLPSLTETTNVVQYNVGVNYDYTITPRMILTLSGSTFRTDNPYSSPNIGNNNLTDQAGIQGFSSPGREGYLGLPNSVSFSGYQGITSPNTPYRIWSEDFNGAANLSVIRGPHSISAGFQFMNQNLLARSRAGCTSGTFTFNGQYTGDGFADYLLGDLQTSQRCYPIGDFGIQRNPFYAPYVQDNWKVTRKLTVELGFRYEYWGAKEFVRGGGTTFDTAIGKAVAAEANNGQVDLTAQFIGPAYGAATANLWVPASQVGYPKGLYFPNGVAEPRVGVAWRPIEKSNLVIRGAYGIFSSNFNGNTTASAIDIPYYSNEVLTFSPTQVQPWRTAWPASPQAFTAASMSVADVHGVAMKTHEWNISVQKALPFDSALTLSYVGNHSPNLVTRYQVNLAQPGIYSNLQAAQPFPSFGTVRIYGNIAKNYYNGFRVRWEKRYSHGVATTFNYNFSKNLGLNSPGGLTPEPLIFAPNGYNYGRSALDHTHILSASMVWDLPFGRGRAFANRISPLANLAIGGWELTGLFTFISGDPLTFDAPGATLGNGQDTRPNLVGNPHVANPSPALWYNPAAFAFPAAATWGNSGIGIMDGPANRSLDMGLMKKFYVRETKFIQFRWEVFNSLNFVNYSDPNLSIGQSSSGKILSAGSARVIQLALKAVF